MRPSLLIISAWGPYPDKVEIDFGGFEDGSVFLVTGPTGAGKTTIFDAISYALYGNVSGTNRDKASVRSDFATPDADTYVDFTFTHKGQSYQITRSPKYERPKKRGEGFTTSAETAVLQIEGEAPIASVQEVNRKVEEVMGINYEQFKQIAMIAQGEFLSLLYAKSEDKVEIFRNLFKTQIYDKMLKGLSERSKNLYARIKEHTNRMDEAIAGIDLGENEELRQLVLMENKNYEKIIDVLKAHIQDAEMIARKNSDESNVVEEEHTNQVKKIADAAELIRNMEQLSKVRDTINGLISKKEAIDQIKLQIQAAKSASKVEVHEKLYQESKQRVVKWKEKITETESLVEVLRLECEKLLVKLQEMKEVEAHIETLKQQVQKLESMLPLLNDLDELTKLRDTLKQKLASAVKKEEQLISEQTLLKEKKRNLQETMKTFDTLDSSLSEVKIKLVEAKQKYESLKQTLLKFDQLQKDEASLKQIQEQYLHEEKNLKVLKERYEAKEQLYRQAAVGLAARFLVDNEPCPVCGSLTHPKKAVVSHDVPDEQELEKEKRILEKEQKVYDEIYRKASEMSGAFVTKKEEFTRNLNTLMIKDPAQLIEEYTKIKEESKRLIDTRKELESKQLKKEECSGKLSECDEKLEQNEKALVSMTEAKVKIQREYDVTDGSVKKLVAQLPENTSKTRVQTELTKYQDKIKMLTDGVTQIREKKEQLYAKRESTETLLNSYHTEKETSLAEMAKLKDQFEIELRNAGFANMEAYHDAKLTSEQLQQKEDAVFSYQDQVTASEEQEKQLQERIAGREKPDIDQMNEVLESLVQKRHSLQAKKEAYSTAISCNVRAYDSLKEKNLKITDLSETYGYVKDLENAAKGVNSERIVFEHYVLAAYFEDILLAANRRLLVMTNGRYELLKVAKVSDQRTKNSLDLEVLDQYTGKRRSVKTLSGGESFKAALSLALGLSDIIQQNTGGIEIDTLFIDEGFGSLDSESLDQALKTLTTLTGSNKLIGIISHVTELKERVDEQIVIERDHRGSKLKVIC